MERILKGVNLDEKPICNFDDNQEALFNISQCYELIGDLENAYKIAACGSSMSCQCQKLALVMKYNMIANVEEMMECLCSTFPSNILIELLKIDILILKVRLGIRLDD